MERNYTNTKKAGLILGPVLFVILWLFKGQLLSEAADPVIAVAGGMFFLFLIVRVSQGRSSLLFSRNYLVLLTLWQLLIGYLNVRLLAPHWLQLVHLCFAECIWIGFVVFSAQVGFHKRQMN